MCNNLSISIIPALAHSEVADKARNHAISLGVPYQTAPITSEFSLVYTEQGLALHSIKGDGTIGQEELHIDFLHGKNRFRHLNNCTTKQPLAKAVGIKPGFRPTIFDATAGLGGDGFVLACLNCKITLCERSSVLHALLENALERAEEDEVTSEIIANNMSLLYGNAADILVRDPTQYHTIYMDPMYPHRTKSALNKKEMRVIRTLVGDDDDAELLLQAALQRAENRVVVKRPKGAPLVGTRKPNHEITMKNSRYDVYLTSI